MPCRVDDYGSEDTGLTECKRVRDNYARGFCETIRFLKSQHEYAFHHLMTNQFVCNLWDEHEENDRKIIIRSLHEKYSATRNYDDDVVYRMYQDGLLKLED